MLQNPFSFRWATLKEKVIEGLDKHISTFKTPARSEGVVSLGPCPFKSTHIFVSSGPTSARRLNMKNSRMSTLPTMKGATYVLERQVGRSWVLFDATRKLDQYGRYTSHARCGVNVKLHPPLKVRGKYRVGFYSLTDIKAGDELFYDYNDRGPEHPQLNNVVVGGRPVVSKPPEKAGPSVGKGGRWGRVRPASPQPNLGTVGLRYAPMGGVGQPMWLW